MTSPRLLLALEHELTGTFPRVRSELAEIARGIHSTVVRRGYFVAFHTFPGWTNPNDMLDYGFLLDSVRLGEPATVCMRISQSPIDESIGGDLRGMSGATQDCIASVTSERDPARFPIVCEPDYIGCGVLECIRDVLAASRWTAAAVAFIESVPPDVSRFHNEETALRALWLSMVTAVDGCAVAVTRPR